MIPEIIIYLLKVNIALLLFYAGYHFILQRYTFHTINRFYLLIGLIYSTLYPFIDLSVIFNRNKVLQETMVRIAPDWQGTVLYTVNQAKDGDNYIWQTILMIFWTGVIIMTMRLLIQLVSLLILHYQSSSITYGDVKFRKIKTKAANPFSFWRTIYLNPDYHEASELRSILEHEQIHVKQLHTVDVILAELCTIFYWFNPGAWLMKNAIKANLEFITDQKVIRSGIDRTEYQYNLLKIKVLSQNAMPVNNFHFLTIKKRIAMINKKPSNLLNLGGYVFVFPVVILLAIMAQSSKAHFHEKSVQLVKQLDAFGDLSPQFNIPSVDRLAIGISSFKSKNTSPPQRENTNFSAGKTAPDTNKIEIKTLNGEGNNITKLIKTMALKDTVLPKTREVIYFLDGVRMSKDLSYINPDSILTIDVIKGSGATSIYGIDTKNGTIDVISIKTKSALINKTKSASSVTNIIKSGENQKISLSGIDNQLIILDGKEINKLDLEQLKVSSIGTIDILKGSSAVSRYGVKGEKGVILITTKK